MVDLLVRKGYLLRVRSQGDRRQVELRLTRKGTQFFDATRSQARSTLSGRLSTLSHSERRDVESSLKLLGRVLDQPVDLKEERK
jgi:DNA-binding MarR family transcriptional regulator